jgi:hypothetical protein
MMTTPDSIARGADLVHIEEAIEFVDEGVRS